MCSIGVGFCLWLSAITGYGAPTILFESSADGYPLTPFPSNEFTAISATSRTGRRVQMPLQGKSQFEQGILNKINNLDGFGTFAPISVPFSEPLDVTTINDQSVFVLNIDQKSDHFGQKILVALGSGLLDPILEKPRTHFKYEPHGELDNYLFLKDNQAFFFDDQSNLLILRPTKPLDEATRYAVILTHDVTGMSGDSIVSTRSTPPHIIRVIQKILPMFNPNHIAYSWDFTTQSFSHDLKVIRDGLHNEGPISHLNQIYTPVFEVISNLTGPPLDIDGDSYLLTPTVLQYVLGFVAKIAMKLGVKDKYDLTKVVQWDDVDYFVFGKYRSPQFNKNASNSFQLDHAKGTYPFVPESVTFLISVPKETETHKPPFPTIIFGHGNKRSRIDVLGIANVFAKAGIATISIDAVGHGPEDFLAAIPKMFGDGKEKEESEAEEPTQDYEKQSKETPPETDTLSLAPTSGITSIFDYGILRVLTKEGRAIDVNDDGITDSGETFFTANLFQTRDVVRQTVVDTFQLVRILKHMGVDQNGNGSLEREEGDFNQDGIPDIAGPENKVYYGGISMGGILGSIILTYEDDIQTAVLNVPGGGLVDVLLRSSSIFTTRRIFEQIWGTAVSGIPHEGRTALMLNESDPENAFTFTRPLPPKSIIYFRNKTKGKLKKARVNEEGGFLVNLPADRGDLMELNIFRQWGSLLTHRQFRVGHQYGLGLTRNTPDFLRFVLLTQWTIDPADPINFTDVYKKKNVLLQVAMGDWTVPTSTGMALGYAGGLISEERLNWLLERKAHRGELFSVDTAENPPESTTGSAIRFFPVGQHNFLGIPSSDPEKSQYTVKAQEQIIRYLLSNGTEIDG